jgi:hypothetical protein
MDRRGHDNALNEVYPPSRWNKDKDIFSLDYGLRVGGALFTGAIDQGFLVVLAVTYDDTRPPVACLGIIQYNGQALEEVYRLFTKVSKQWKICDSGVMEQFGKRAQIPVEVKEIKLMGVKMCPVDISIGCRV